MAKIGVIHPSSLAIGSLLGDQPGIELLGLSAFESCADRLPRMASGLLIVGREGHDFPAFTQKIIDQAIERGLPILASGSGMHLLNAALGGGDPIESAHVDRDAARNGGRASTSIFLAPGAKTSSTIGGSGWLSIGCDHKLGIEQSSLSPSLMTACISDDRFVEAYEVPGHHWVIGVQWDVTIPGNLPRGFDNVLLAFLERSAGA